MIVYLAAGLTALFYAWHVPVRAAFALSVGSESRLKLGVGVFEAEWIYERSIALSPASLYAQWKKRRTAPKIDSETSLKVARYLFRHIEVSGVRIFVAVGTGDAAQTALLCGAIQSLVQVIRQIFSVRIRSQILPDFQGRRLLVSAGGALSVKLGYIIHALALIALDVVSGKMHRRGKALQNPA